MTKSWSVPFPESETEHDGMPVFLEIPGDS